MKDILIIVVGAVAAFLLWTLWQEADILMPERPAACTAEAKICPDGSSVGRTGPDCAFAPCPDIAESWGTISGTVMLGPTCPVMREPPDPECADKPYATALALTTPDGERVVRQFFSDETGAFRLDVPAGVYAIHSAAVANILPYCSTNETVTVVANDSVTTTVWCDTGIR